MISIGLCGAAFLLCLYLGRRSLVGGLCALTTVGYAYGILRANLPDGFSHLIFDAATLGLYVAQFGLRQPLWQHARAEDVRNWLMVLIAWPVMLFAMPWQDPLIQVVGLRGSIFLLPFMVLGARLTGDDVYKLGLWFSVLNLAAGGLALAEYTLGVDRFFPRNAVTEIIYRSKDLANFTAFRIPSSFGNAHAYAATMVLTTVIIAGSWVQGHHGRWQPRLMSAALLMSMLGVFMSATRVNALILFALIVTSIFTGRVKGAYRFRWLILLALLAYSVGGDERLQRFRSLQDPEFIAQRFGDSVNVSFFELVRKYPLGNGLGGGGTSVPYFLQNRIRNVVVMENEYARILLELGIPGLLMWLLFIGWVFTRRQIKKTDMFYFGRRLAFVAVVSTFATGLIGTGMLTSVPSTAIVLLLTGWIVAPEVRFAPRLRAAGFVEAGSQTVSSDVWLPPPDGRCASPENRSLPPARKINSSIVDDARTT
jgi:hypothetical protein